MQKDRHHSSSLLETAPQGLIVQPWIQGGEGQGRWSPEVPSGECGAKAGWVGASSALPCALPQEVCSLTFVLFFT